MVLKDENSDIVRDDADVPPVFLKNELSLFNDVNLRTSVRPLEQRPPVRMDFDLQNCTTTDFRC
jgi:hypothetical protein